jgi:cell wall integrity and stress response component
MDLILVWIAILAITVFHPAEAQLQFCSSQNTGADGNVSVSISQSNGLCSQTCQGFAFAILQDKECWCSNTQPGETVSLSDCDDPCPGYPPDKCGNLSQGLFGYILLATPSSTLQASSSTSSSASTSGSSSSGSSSSSTTTSSTVSSVSTVTSVSSAAASAISSQSASTSAIQSTASTSSDNPSSTGGTRTNDSSGGFFNNKGAVAGVFTVVALAIVGLLALLVFYLYRRRKSRYVKGSPGNESITGSSRFGGSPRFGSGGSGSGLRRDESTLTTIAGFDEKSKDNSTTVPIVDQRLDPRQVVYMRWGETDSRRSLQDEFDYSRKVLRVANPGRELYDE